MGLDYFISELNMVDLKNDLNGFLNSLKSLSIVGNISSDSAKEILSRINNQNGHIYVAKTKTEEIIGCITLLIEQKFIHDGGKVGHIEDVSVRKEYEKKGIGSSLVNTALDQAKLYNCYKIILDCDKKNIPFYEKLGFKLNGVEMRFNLE